MEGNKQIRAFISYAWDSQEHKDIVYDFVVFLRNKGVHADFDHFLSQEHSAIDFTKMMHQGMTDYDKVIIVLSPAYKLKADGFSGGVGVEYSLIIKDIEQNNQKYILVSPYGRSNNVIPLAFMGRDVIDISSPMRDEEWNRLKSKLTGKPIYVPNQVKTGDLEVTQISPSGRFSVQDQIKESIDIKTVELSQLGATLNHSKYKTIDCYITATIQNISSSIIKDMVLEIEMPVQLCRHTRYENITLREEGQKAILTVEINRLMPKQSYATKQLQIMFWNYEIDDYSDQSIVVRVFLENETPEKTFSIADVLKTIKNRNGAPITKGDFLDRYQDY